MDQSLNSLISAIFSGGHNAIIALLLLFIAYLIWEIKHLRNEIIRKDEKVDRIVSDYYNGNMSVTDALNSLRAVLNEIKSNL